MAEDHVNVGDAVQLMSGGPAMTVEFTDQGDGFVYCTWFNKGELRQGKFRPPMLKPVDPDDILIRLG